MSDLFAERGTVVRPFSSALADVIEALRDAGIRYALVGGVAAGKRGEARATRDIDIVVASSRGVVSALRPITQKVLPFSPIGHGDRMAKFIHDETGIEIDVLVLRSAAGRSALDDATPARIGRDLQAPVAPAEALVCLKLTAAVSPDREPRKRRLDEADVLAILSRQGERFDHRDLRALVADLPAPLRARVRRKLDELLEELP